ncbi:MAG TPA: protoporphyrinogen oxidase, partial [Limnochordia bacterium]
LLARCSPDASSALSAIRNVSVAIVALGYDDPSFRWPLPGTGYVVPRTERVPCTACTWASAKWPHASTPGRPLFRVHFGRAGNEAPAHWPDERLIAAARHELAVILGVRAAPALVRVFRWPQAMPQYDVGHLERLRRIEAALSDHPGLFLAGAAYRGVGIPDCIRQAEEASVRIRAYLERRLAAAVDR